MQADRGTPQIGLVGRTPRVRRLLFEIAREGKIVAQRRNPATGRRCVREIGVLDGPFGGPRTKHGFLPGLLPSVRHLRERAGRASVMES
jgi:hypothetical protein